MISISKFLVAGFLGVALLGSGVPVANGQTTADLQAQIAALLNQINLLQAQLNAQTGTPTGVTLPSTRNLTVGSTGEDVRALQHFLNSQGFVVAQSGPGSPGSETAYFGPLTRAALAQFQAANGISPPVGYYGPITRSFISSMITTPPPTPPTPPTTPATGLTVALASDNPAGGAVPTSASGVQVLRFVVTGSGTLQSLTFERTGVGATSDFASSGFTLLQGDTRLTTGRTLNSTTHQVSFHNLNLQVNGSVTLTLTADIASGAGSGNRHAFRLVSAVGDPSVSGTLTGNEFIIASQSAGSITAVSGAAPTNPKVGQQNAKIAEFRLTAGSTEDVELRRVSLFEGGSIADSNLSNFVLKQGGNTIATASAVSGRDLIVFNLTNPMILAKGDQRTFEVFANIGGNARAGDTIVLYFDSSSDIYAIGQSFGFPVSVNITSLDTSGEGDTLTLQGGEVTITFNGPIASDIALRAQDVNVFDFTISSQNNVEIRNLRLHATTTGLTSGQGFNDFKIWDRDTNSVITSAVDVTTSADVTFTDVINLNAGQTRNFRVTVDVDADNDAGDTILVSLLAFQSSDIRNLDNNTFVSSSAIVPNSTVSGNTQTVQAPALDVQLSANPSSETYARGTNDQPLVGFAFRAVSDDVRLDTVRVTASATSGTLTSGELQSLALYDGTTRVSDFESLDNTTLTATFDNLNLTIQNGQTKVLTVRGNISTNADAGDIYFVYIATVTTSDLTAFDSEGNSVTLQGSAANSGNTITITVVSTGDVTVSRAADDVESEAGIVIANREQVLGKFRFTAANEAMTINDLQLLVNNTNSATATTAGATDEVPVVKLYNGATQVGSSAGYSVQASGANSGVAVIENLGLVVPKDGSVTLTVKGVLNSITGGADSGASVYVHVMSSNFEAQGANAKDTTITAASGNQKVVYKTRPTITVAAGDSQLTNGLRRVLNFTVAADSAEQVAWRKVQLEVTMTSATMSAVTAAPGTTGNVQLRDTSTSSNVNIATAFSASSTAGAVQNAIAGGATGYVTLLLNQEEVVPAGGSKTYEVYLTFADVPSGSASAVVKLHRAESTVVGGTSFSSLEGTQDGSPSFGWSDYSTVGHSQDTSTDWANGVFVKTLPSTSHTISKT